jgi:hypothetical protein
VTVSDAIHGTQKPVPLELVVELARGLNNAISIYARHNVQSAGMSSCLLFHAFWRLFYTYDILADAL